MAKDLTPQILTLSASLGRTLDQLIYDYDDRVARVFRHRRGYYDPHTDPLCNTHRAVGDFLSINAEGNITYLPAGRIDMALSRGMEWQKKYRQSGRPAKVIRSMLTPDALKRLTDADFEDFTNNLRAKAKRDQASIQVVSGEDIRYWYHGDRYSSGSGTLRTSCMRYEECQSYMDFYVNNPDAIQMAVMTNGSNKLIARALLWNTVETGWVFDRAYGNDVSIQILREWAREQGYPVRTYNSYEQETLWNTENGEGEQLFLTVNLLTGSSRGYPYCDTFKYLFIDEDTGTIRVKNHQRWQSATYELCSTDGHPFIQTCSACGIEGDTRQILDGMCYDCRMANLCVACEYRTNGHGPDGTMCGRCAIDYRCRVCHEYRTSQHYARPNRPNYLYPSYTISAHDQHPRCESCYAEWLRTQPCPICECDLTLNNVVTYPADRNIQASRSVCCTECYRAHSCYRCGTVTQDRREIRFNVGHAYREEYTETLCPDCAAERCSYCGDACGVRNRGELRDENVCECSRCRLHRKTLEQQDAMRRERLTVPLSPPNEDAGGVVPAPETADAHLRDALHLYHTSRQEGVQEGRPVYTYSFTVPSPPSWEHRWTVNTDRAPTQQDTEEDLDIPW